MVYVIQQQTQYQWEPIPEGEFDTLDAAISAKSELETFWSGLRVIDSDGSVVVEPTQYYMNIETGSVDTYDGWSYTNDDGETVNAVDLGEVVPVKLDNDDWIEI